MRQMECHSTAANHEAHLQRDDAVPGSDAGSDCLYRRMVSEARRDLFVKATCLENSDQSLTLFLTE